MKVTVKFFGFLEESARAKQKIFEAPDRTSVRQLYQMVLSTLPEKKRWPRVLFAVNQEFAAPSHLLKDGDELALIPPMSGG